MKNISKIAVMAFVLLLSLETMAQGVLFQDIPWAVALKKAKAEGKGVFVDVYTSWCGPCKKMSREVFVNDTVANYMNTHFVCLKVDAEKQAGHEAMREAPPSAYPSYYWYTADGKLLSVNTGYHPAKEFLELNESAMKDDISKAFNDARRQWEEGNRSPQFVKDYLFTHVARMRPDSLRPLFNAYLSELSDSERSSRETGEMAVCFMRSIRDDMAWRTIVDNDTIYLRYFGEDFGRNLYMNLVRIPGIDRKRSQQLYNNDMRCIEGHDYPLKTMFARLRSMESMLSEHNYSEAIDSALSIGREHEAVYPYVYTNALYSLVINEFFVDERTPSQAECSKALELALEAYRVTPSQCTLMYLAAAYARGGDYKQAYNTLASLPFHKSPVLTNAVYSLLNLRTVTHASTSKEKTLVR
ncbi:MAG: thioredoxin family protein [Prevotella sp.]